MAGEDECVVIEIERCVAAVDRGVMIRTNKCLVFQAVFTASTEPLQVMPLAQAFREGAASVIDPSRFSPSLSCYGISLCTRTDAMNDG